jgi:hypothetical protein
LCRPYGITPSILFAVSRVAPGSPCGEPVEERCQICPRFVAARINPNLFDALSKGSYWNGVRRYVRTGDESGLWPLEGAGVGLYRFETDPDEIDYWAIRGELEFEDIY